MSLHMTTIDITPSPELAERLPEEQAFVAAAMADGSITSLHVAEDRRELWIVIDRDDEADVRSFVDTFPHAPWFTVRSVQPVFSA